jgi:hypothetical protein
LGEGLPPKQAVIMVNYLRLPYETLKWRATFMTDPISRLRGLTKEIKGKEQELGAYFNDL